MHDKCVFVFNFILKGANFCLFVSTSPNSRNEVLMMVTMKVTGFWVVTRCSLIEVYQHFRGIFLRNVGRPLPGNTASHCRSLFNLLLFTFYTCLIHGAISSSTPHHIMRVACILKSLSFCSNYYKTFNSLTLIATN